MAFDVEAFSKRLKDLRIEKELTTIQLGKALAVSDATVSRWENGLRIPCADNIYNIAEFFCVPAGWLIGLEN